MNRNCLKLKKNNFFRKAKHLTENRKYTQHFVEHVLYIIFEHNKLIRKDFVIDYIYTF